MKAKKLLTFFVAVLTALTLGVSFVACGGDDKPKNSCKHNWTVATCTEPVRCTLCNATNGKAAGHKYEYNSVAATCDSDGRNESECSVCHDKTLVVIPKLTHQYESAVTSALACETDEVTTYTCKLCDEAYSETTKRHAGHDTEGVTWTKKSEDRESQCEYIITETTKCKTCKEDIERTYHKHVYVPVVLDASCKDGTVQYGCVCGNPEYNYTDVLPVSPAMHNWQPTNKAGADLECAECGTTMSAIIVNSDSATITASQIAGKSNIAISTGNNVMLQPDATLTGKMSGGVEVVAEEVDLPSSVKGEDAQILEGATVYNFELNNTNGNKIDFGTGKMTVSVPYYDSSDDYDPASVVACYIDDNGNVKYQQATCIDGVATFDAEHFSHYTVVRLTAEQRCAKLGHNNVETVVAATCTEDGYTVKSCKRCGNFERIPGAKKIGHDYSSSVVAATCTDKGYTLMACKHEGCDESYVTKYTAVVPHSYTDKKVNATCTAKGYTEHTCKNCGSSYRDSYTDMVAHNYSKGVCSVCGKSSDASAADNFYINFINSIGKTESFYVDLSDMDINIVTKTSSTETVSMVIDAYRLSVGIDSDGYLVGSGEGKAKITLARGSNAPSVMDENILIAFKNKNIYTCVTMTEARSGVKKVTNQYDVVSQDDAELGDIKQYVKSFYSAPVKKVVNALLDGNAKNSPLNAGIAKVMDYLFDKTESASGYTLTLNYEHAAKAVEYANTHNAAEVFNAIIGDGKFDEIVKFAQDLPEMTLDEFIYQAKKIADEFGLKINDFYDIIDTTFKTIDKTSTVNALDYVSKNGSKKMSAVVEELSGGKITADVLKSIIDEAVKNYVPMLKKADTSLIKLLASLVPLGSDFDFADYIKSSLDALNIAAKDKISVVIATDYSGAFESVSVKANNFNYTQDIPAAIGRQDASVKVDGKLSFVITTVQGAIGSNANIVTAIDKAKSDYQDVVKKNVGKVLDNKDGYYDGSAYTVAFNAKDGKYALVPHIDAAYVSRYYRDMAFEKEGVEYNGASCDVYSLRTYRSGYILDLDGDYSYAKSCSGWVESSVSANYMYSTYYKVYMQGSQVKGVEFDWDRLELERYNGHAPVYVNVAQGKLSLNEPHKYVLINKSKDPTACEQTVYDTYRCTVCGSFDYHYRTKWHDYEYTYELKSGAKDCTGGVVEIGKCKDCGKTTRYEDDGIDYNGEHRKYNVYYPVKGAVCTDTVVSVYKCVCGAYVQNVYVGGGEDACHFDSQRTYCSENGGTCKHGYIRHYTDEYQCYLSKCGYTYTREYIGTAPDSNCVSKEWEVVTLKDGTKYTTTAREYTNHNTTHKTTTEGELSVITLSCTRCNKQFGVEKYDKYDRQVYYFSYESKNGWEKVFDKNCNYVRYSLDENGKRGEKINSGIEHEMRFVSLEEKHSCTQPHDRVDKCAACGLTATTEYFYGHEFDRDYETGEFKCYYCGMTNDNWAEGPVSLEDLNKGNTAGALKVGYHTRCRIKATDIEFYTDYYYGDGNPVEVKYTDDETGEESGIITIEKAELKKLLDDGAQSFTVVFAIKRGFNYEGYEYRTYEIAITFTVEELAVILGL
ncbi:MAG: hypothetical protein K2O04_03595 [Clostridiales bacterium]|nr:hypothetical protein [Clostridiales bacterium]